MYEDVMKINYRRIEEDDEEEKLDSGGTPLDKIDMPLV